MFAILHDNQKLGIAGGTLCVIIANIHSNDIIKTAILSMTGAAVSFIVSYALKRVMRWFGKPPRH